MADGWTHASRVIPVVRSNPAESATVTQSLTPSNERAPPYLPVVQVAPEIVPVIPPTVLFTVVPVPSLNPNAATSRVFVLLVVTVTPEEVPMLPAASRALAVITCVPLAT